MRLRVVSMMSENAAPLHRAVARYLDTQGLEARFVEDVPWRERQRMLLNGEADLGFLCGLPYAREADRPRPRIVLVGAPVMQGPRYAGRPIYFSDLVVCAGSRFRSFADLRGAAWAYNEPGSHSGYWLTRWHLARLGEVHGFFGRAVEAGSHLNALDQVLRGAVDGASIDSTVLDTELRKNPALARRIRILGTLGPSAAPPLVASTRLPQAVRDRVAEVVLGMHLEPEGRALLDAECVLRYTRCSDHDYDGIRGMAARARGVPLASPAILALGA
ncbi:MAG: phosphate ABC transporter substrate-binding protein [Armatimonadetes bacterium]|nr:phosphate ABC transporter substrate-binding protein [Armatimonadota bacterium]